jgi:urease subunit alpha
MKKQRGALPGETGDDNRRVKRYVAKYDQPVAHGLAEHVGSIEVGKPPASSCEAGLFRRQARVEVKGGLIAWAAMGDPNASIPTPQPVLYRPMFSAGPGAEFDVGDVVSAAALAADVPRRLG